MQPERTTEAVDHTACQANVQTIYDYAVEIMDSPPGLGTQRELFEHRLGTAGCLYHREGLTDFIRERDALAEALDDLHRYSLIPDYGYAGSPCEAKVRAALEAVGRQVP